MFSQKYVNLPDCANRIYTVFVSVFTAFLKFSAFQYQFIIYSNETSWDQWVCQYNRKFDFSLCTETKVATNELKNWKWSIRSLGHWAVGNIGHSRSSTEIKFPSCCWMTFEFFFKEYLVCRRKTFFFVLANCLLTGLIQLLVQLIAD